MFTCEGCPGWARCRKAKLIRHLPSAACRRPGLPPCRSHRQSASRTPPVVGHTPTLPCRLRSSLCCLNNCLHHHAPHTVDKAFHTLYIHASRLLPEPFPNSI